MPVITDPAIIQNYYEVLFGVSVSPVSYPSFQIGLLDPSGVELTGGGYSRQARDAGSSFWQSYQTSTGCGGVAGAGVGTAGITNTTSIDFGITTANWQVGFVAIYDNTGTEIMRVAVPGSASYSAGTGVVIAPGALTLGSEYIL